MFNEQKALIQDEAFEELKRSGYNGIFILPTGTGKGRVLVKCLEDLNPDSILYLCDNRKLRDIDFPAELVEWGAERFLEKMTRMCYAGARNMDGNHYNLLIADEADYGLTPEYSKVFFNNAFDHNILCSATLFGEKRALAEKIVPIVYEKKLIEVEDAGALNRSNFYWVNYIMDEAEQTKYRAYNKKFVEYIARSQEGENMEFLLRGLTNERRIFMSNLESSRKITRKLISHLYREDPEIRGIVFFNSTDQADSTMPYTYHGKNEKEDWLQKFRDKEINWLGVVGKIDRGVNIEGIRKVIMESCVSSPAKAIQRIGRAKRLAADDYNDVYFVIPHFYNNPPGIGEVKGKFLKPTKVKDWVLNATKSIDLSGIRQFSFEEAIQKQVY